jgi:hypothetical protein
MKEPAFPQFDGKTYPYERWWANPIALLHPRVSQHNMDRDRTKHSYRVEVFVEYLDEGRSYRNMVKSWVTDPLTKEMVHAASANYILLTQMENPEPWNMAETTKVRQIGNPKESKP